MFFKHYECHTFLFLPLKNDYTISKFVTDNVLWEAKTITENAENLHNLLKIVNLPDMIFSPSLFLLKTIYYIILFYHVFKNFFS